ncbi:MULTISPECIES: hypothetical protein [unclassified Lentimonas]|uniref:hypothetical protein n=1 Tax=unclassified Lentimonas TaxID=2630993 RepID=UPI0013230063|nr:MULTISPECIES: hypothetical protein [unclassified Lentimonas]CAA6676713.1 Unannotated [Lentimonas sp. CC4]CAA6684622.1 Unannotated [Lentimonas sp. CC6]CAA7075258.1 Unannotated [Lentimonas sp. CC4]CAA7170643.1 Unannotated [Lentimonas sp. CC21]CAA7182334.1 Unannotated [Lentimonas sp. CC8]
MMFTDFITQWADTGASERANFQPFCGDICIERPQGSKPNQTENVYVFEKSVPLHQPDGTATTSSIRDLRPDDHPLEASEQRTEEDELEVKSSVTTTKAKTVKQAWPKTVAEQVAQHFKGVRAPKVQSIAEALIALGHAA